jgi:hypothetical protein
MIAVLHLFVPMCSAWWERARHRPEAREAA